MRTRIVKCDICGRTVKESDVVNLKAKSQAFVDYGNYDDWHPDRVNWDICFDCIKEIKEKINPNIKENK